MAIHISVMVKDMLGDFCDIQFLSHEEVATTRSTHDENGELASAAEQDFVEVLTGYEFEHGA